MAITPTWKLPAGKAAAKKAATSKVAIIIKGNPAFINTPSIKPMADKLYAQIKALLEKRGYTVKFDRGAPFTMPDEKAQLWVAHSRGVDRLRFAPATVQTWAIQTTLSPKVKAYDAIGKHPDHYTLSKNDLAFLNGV